MLDKYCYERSQMALHDRDVKRYFATGIAGLSVVADSLSAIKFAKVKVIRTDVEITKKVKDPQTAKSVIKTIGVAKNVATDFEVEGEFPKYGNNDDRVDKIAVEIVEKFMAMVRSHYTYRNGVPTTSILTITSNVTYGNATGSTPDGRKAGVPFAPGANPMHGRDKNGAIASLSSVAKLRYRDAQDGISNTFSIVPKSLGVDRETRIENLITMMDGYFTKGAHHLNVNVLNREMLEDAMEHPEKYPQLTIRVSGYAVNFIKLSREHQLEVISRSFHERM